jgi:hypothetical protein
MLVGCIPNRLGDFLPSSVQDGQEVTSETSAHSCIESLNLDEVDGNEKPQEEEKRCSGDQVELRVLEAFQEDLQLECSGPWCETRADSQGSDDHHSQNGERDDPHCPGKSHLGDQMRCHDGKNHTSQPRPSSHLDSWLAIIQEQGKDTQLTMP